MGKETFFKTLISGSIFLNFVSTRYKSGSETPFTIPSKEVHAKIGVSDLGYLILKNDKEEICISCDEINLKESLR